VIQPLTFFVDGIPKPAGSKRAFVMNGRAIIVDANKNAKDWKTDVKFAAKELIERERQTLPVRGPIKLTVVFTMPRPKYHYGKHGIKADAPKWHTVKPDATKLLRGTEDALTSLLWGDDAQIAVQKVSKVYGSRPGAHITIEEAGE